MLKMQETKIQQAKNISKCKITITSCSNCLKQKLGRGLLSSYMLVRIHISILAVLCCIGSLLEYDEQPIFKKFNLHILIPLQRKANIMPLNNNTNGCLTINTQVNLNTTRSNSQATSFRFDNSYSLIVLYQNKFKLDRIPFISLLYYWKLKFLLLLKNKRNDNTSHRGNKVAEQVLQHNLLKLRCPLNCKQCAIIVYDYFYFLSLTIILQY